MYLFAFFIFTLCFFRYSFLSFFSFVAREVWLLACVRACALDRKTGRDGDGRTGNEKERGRSERGRSERGGQLRLR